MAKMPKHIDVVLHVVVHECKCTAAEHERQSAPSVRIQKYCCANCHDSQYIDSDPYIAIQSVPKPSADGPCPGFYHNAKHSWGLVSVDYR